MPNYTTNLNLAKPLQDEQYDIDVFNANADKIDNFAGQIPTRALTADTLTTARKINGVSFKGNADITLPIVNSDNDTIINNNGTISVNTDFIYNKDFIHNSKALETGAVSDNAVIYPWIYNMAHSTFDLTKFDVVGTPVISTGGVLSVNRGSYVRPATSVLQQLAQADNWQIKLKGTIPPIGNGNVCILGSGLSDYNIFLGRANTNDNLFLRFWVNDNGTYKEIVTYASFLGLVGQKYNATISFDGAKYSAHFVFENGTSKDLEIESSLKITTADTSRVNNLYIGYVHPSVTGFIDNSYSIDLNFFKIYVDGVEVFSGNKTGTDSYTINNETVTIPYTESATGSKIVNMSYLDRVKDVYETQGYAPYYTIDEENETFALPMGEIYGMTDKKIDELKTETTSALAEKADTDLGNALTPAQSFKNVLIANIMPDWTRAITILQGEAKNGTYTAPANGYFYYVGVSGYGTQARISVNNRLITAVAGGVTIQAGSGSYMLNVDDIIDYQLQISTWNVENLSLYFVPFVGNGQTSQHSEPFEP